MTQEKTDKLGPNSNGSNERPDPEVLPRTKKAKRRTFTADYKLWLLEETDKCRERPGGIGGLLRWEGLDSGRALDLLLLSAKIFQMLGYEVMAVIEGLGDGHQKLFLCKSL